MKRSGTVLSIPNVVKIRKMTVILRSVATKIPFT